VEREERLKAAGERGGLRRRAAETKVRGQPIARARVDRVEMSEPIVLKNFCAAIGVAFNRVFPKLMAAGKMARITDAIDQETARLVAAEFDVELTVKEARSLMDELRQEAEERERQNLEPRPPIVTLLGHVDHGKTSLLDAIRKSRVIDQEAGGITQQIGAYRFCEGNVDVTFIDTPGHEAFTSMRSRGATMTDVVVLVVAADDGIMQTTREAIQHARAADVPIVVALNKIDLPGVDVNRTYGQLAEENLTPAEWGGEVDVIKTSAITGEGVSSLLEHLTTLTELLELRGDATVPSTGWIVETEEKLGEGVVATLLVTDGTLEPGSVVVCGPAHGRVRAMRDDHGQQVVSAGPGTPVEVSGLDIVPAAGDRYYEISDLKRAKQIAQEQQDRLRAESLADLSKPRTLEELFQERESDEVPELNVILRADTHGKLETLRAELSHFPDDQVRLRILLDGIGAVTESDVMLASTSEAVIIGYWVVAEDSARRMAQDLGIDMRFYRVIYEVTDDIRKALEGLLEPERQEEYQGRLEVRQVFNISRVGTVAGCYVVDGTVARTHTVRLIRDGAVVREDCSIGSLRRIKDDVREVRAGLECGLKIEGFDDVHVGDTIEAYEVVEVARSLA
jgi:translation initiation factor IF-2